jgi:hypothetical protein
VEWDSQSGKKADPNLKRFLFMLKNPRNFPARKRALKAKEKRMAIIGLFLFGPCFRDILVSDNCNANTGSCNSLGFSYANNTGRDGSTVLTGSCNFTVKDIEVFEITD